MWVERPRLTHTTSQGPLFPRGSHHHWRLLCTRGPTSRRCGHARRRSAPTPRGDEQATHPHTHTHSQRNRAVCQGPDIATVWTCPTPVYTHTARRCTKNTHRARAIVLCALRRPTCPQSNTIGRNQAGCSHSSANTLGPVHHMAMAHQTDDKSKGRKKKGVHQQRVLC